MQRMSDNPDRKVLLIAARSQADVLARKQLIIVSTGKAQPRISLTVFEQAQVMKQTKIKRLMSENKSFITKSKKSKKELPTPSTPAQNLFSASAATTVAIKIKRLQKEPEEAEYSEKEITIHPITTHSITIHPITNHQSPHIQSPYTQSPYIQPPYIQSPYIQSPYIQAP
jgi:hypothetical protein